MSTIKGFKVGNNIMTYQDANIADEFSENKTYEVGDYCIRPTDGKLYKCVVAVTLPSNWNSSNWEETQVDNELNNITNTIITEIRKTADAIYTQRVYSTTDTGLFLIQSGGINLSTGVIYTDEKRARTATAGWDIDGTTRFILDNNNYNFAVMYYSGTPGSETYLGNSGWVKNGSVIAEYDGAKKIRLQFIRKDEATMTTTDYNAISVALKRYNAIQQVVVDDTLTIPGAAMDAKMAGDILFSMSNRLSAVANEINYDYNTFIDIPQDSTSSTVLNRYGIKRELTQITLNSAAPRNYVIRIKLSGSVERAASNADIDRWTSGIKLIEGHTYSLETKLISGTITPPEGANPPIAVPYKIGTHSSFATTVRDGYNAKATFVAPTEEINIIMYIPSSVVMIDAIYQIILRDLDATFMDLKVTEGTAW